MASKAQIRASIKWNKNQDSITIRPAKAIGEAIRAAAADCGESVTAYILETVRRRMESEQATPPEWVSVTDRLPEVGSYLVRESDGNIETADYHAVENTPGEFYRYFHGQIEPLADVTHWMCLPAQPTANDPAESDTT